MRSVILFLFAFFSVTALAKTYPFIINLTGIDLKYVPAVELWIADSVKKQGCKVKSKRLEKSMLEGSADCGQKFAVKKGIFLGSVRKIAAASEAENLMLDLDFLDIPADIPTPFVREQMPFSSIQSTSTSLEKKNSPDR